MIQFNTGNFIPIQSEGSKQTDDALDKDIANLFKEASVEEPTEKKRKGRRKEITASNLRELDSQDIKDTKWERVAGAKRSTDFVGDMNAIRPSRSEGETDNGGSSIVSSALNSILDPTQNEKYAKQNAVTDSIVKQARKTRQKVAEKGQNKTDWEAYTENDLTAKGTKDFHPSQLGFTPHLSAFAQKEIPSVEIPAVEAIKAQSAQSAIDGKKAAQIKMALDKIMETEFSKKAEKSWEEMAVDQINNSQTKAMKIEEQSIKLADDFVGEKTHIEASKQDFSNWFNVPENPNEIKKEASIKRDTKKLSANRKRREDDRSWEVVKLPKKTW